MTTLVESRLISHDNESTAARTTRTWHPVSNGQRALWLAYKLQPQLQGDFNIALSMRTRPALDHAKLRRALEALVARHPMLRARFRDFGGEPRQAISSEAVVPLRVIEIESLDDGRVEACVRAERIRPIALDVHPPISASLYHAGERESVLSLVFDHIATDGWSVFQLTEELGELLVNDTCAAARQPADTSADFLEYVQHERDWLTSKRADKQLAYWRETLARANSDLPLRPDFRHADALESRANLEWVIPADVSSALRDFADAQGTSLFVTLLAGYAVLLHRLSGQDQVSIGSAMPTRGDRWKRTIGNLVNRVVMPTVVTDDMTVAELLKATQSLCLRTLKNKDYPFDALAEHVQPDRPAGASPFRASYVFQKARHAQNMMGIVAHCRATGVVRWADCDIEAFGDHLPSGGAGLDLTLETIDLGEHICAEWGYDARAFSRDTIQRFARSWVVMLEAMIAQPARRVASLPWLDACEREQLLCEWNATALEFPSERCAHELFELHVARTPDAVAVQYEAEVMSYAELNARANQLAAHLRSLGVRPDVRVGVCAERGMDWLVALLATLKAGGAYVPLDPAYPSERLAHMIGDSAPAVLLAHGIGRGVVAALAGTVPIVDLTADAKLWADAPCADVSPRDLGLTPRHLAYVIYTSGSTGVPKGVMNEHRGLCNLIAAQATSFGVGTSSRVLQFASPSFDASMWEIVMALSRGARLQLAARADLMPGRALLTTLSAYRTTHVTLPPSALSLCDVPDLPFVPTTVIVAGEAISPSEAKKWSARVTLFNAYGPTETTVCATLHRCAPESTVVPIGRPIANARIYLLDAHREPVPAGVPGEIYIGGVPVGRGYLNRPELTAERFVDDPFIAGAGARMYKTGDLGRWLADGSVEYLGRNDSQVKLRGFRIELGEIEARLSEVEGVTDVALLIREDEPGDARLVAYYTGPRAPAVRVLRSHASAHLPDYMVPAAFVRLAAFPVTPNGKIDRKALPKPGGTAYASRSYVAPEGTLEQALGKIWSQLLRRERVGRHDNFFELGGHSLRAVELMTRVQRELHVDVPLRTLFASQTLSEFAAAVGERQRDPRAKSNLVALRPTGTQRPLFGVHPLGGTVEYVRLLAEKLDERVPIYGLEASAWDTEESPCASLASLVARYIAAIRSVQPQGPYRLMGYSAGGVIVYAMAEALIAQGETIEFLGIIDSHADLGVTPSVIEAVEQSDRVEGEQGLDLADATFLRHTFTPELPQDVRDELGRALASGDFSSALAAVNQCGLKLNPGLAAADPPTVRRAIRVMRSTQRALCHYRPAQLPVSATLFAANGITTSSDPTGGWGKILSERLRTVAIGGTHFSIMEPPYIDALGDAIGRALASGTCGGASL